MRKVHLYDDSALFLDRDGVITEVPSSEGKTGGGTLHFLPGVLSVFPILGTLFRYIFVVTNQQPVAYGRLNLEQLQLLHGRLRDEVDKGGGRIDAIYASTSSVSSGSLMHKPAVGMGLAARRNFPGFNFRHSVMVGDRRSDMEFGKRLGMVTFLVGANPYALAPPLVVDYAISSLVELPDFLEK